MTRRGAALLILGVIGCGNTLDATQIMVIVDAEPGVRMRTEELHVTVKGSGGRAGLNERAPYDRTFNLGADTLEWPHLTALAPLDRDTERVYTFEATALNADGQFVAQVRALSGYVKNKTLALHLVLEDRCVGVMCMEKKTCADAECVDANVDPATLKQFTDQDSESTIDILSPGVDRDSGTSVRTDGGMVGGTGGTGGTAVGTGGAGSGGTGGTGVSGGSGGMGSTEGGYRKKLTISEGKVTMTLSDFPVLVRLTGDSDLIARTRADGNDIRFKDAMGNSVLAFERESFNKTTGELIAWVKVPSVTSAGPNAFYLYYGDDNATDLSDAAAVWDANFATVWHMDGNPAASGGIVDSTSPANNSTSFGGDITSDDSVPALIGNGVYLDASGDYVNFNSAGLPVGLDEGTALTVSVWAQLDALGGPLINKGLAVAYRWSLSSSGQVAVRDGDGQSPYAYTSAVPGVADPTAFNHYVMVYDGAGADNPTRLKLYYNGAVQSLTYTGVVPAAFNANAGALRIGKIESTQTNASVDGRIDEVHISTAPRSAAWVKAEYDNQKDGSTFVTVGVEEPL